MRINTIASWLRPILAPLAPRRRAYPLARRLRVGVLLSWCGWLDALTELHGGTDKRAHGYLPFYRQHLGPRRHTRLRVLEIGVGMYESRGAGGSLAVWRDYCWRSELFGADIHPKDIRLGRRVRFAQFDQSDAAAVARFADSLECPLDVVIDDGSHVGSHIWTTFTTLFPRLRAGGLYIIEDLATSYWSEFGGAPEAPSTSSVALLRVLVNDAQKGDPSIGYYNREGPVVMFNDVAAVTVHPGIAFIRKVGP